MLLGACKRPRDDDDQLDDDSLSVLSDLTDLDELERYELVQRLVTGLSHL